MKLLTKVLVGALLTGGVTTMIYAGPGDLGGDDPRASSYPEMVSRAHDAQEAMVADYRHVSHLQQIARKQRDAVKLNCVNDKLVQIKPLMNDADRGRSELDASLSQGGSFYAVVAGDASTVHRLREEADQCVGEGISTYESSNSWTGPGLPDNPYQDPFGTIGEPPAYASPFD